jgi:hypothetical protein
MPLPPVTDRIKEFPGQALRAVFAGVGQLLLAADKVWEQLSGSGHAPAQQADQAVEPQAAAVAAPAAAARPAAASSASPASAASPAAAPQAPEAADSRWRSLDKTGNVRLLGGDDAELAEPASTPAAAAEAPVAAEPAGTESAELAEPTSAEVAEPTPAEMAEPAAAELAEPEPAEVAVPEPAEVAKPEPVEPVLAAASTEAPSPEPAPAAAAPAEAAPAEAALPVPGYDQLTVASLRARLRVLDAAQVQTLLDYEKAHEGRTAVITMFERRIAKLEEGS